MLGEVGRTRADPGRNRAVAAPRYSVTNGAIGLVELLAGRDGLTVGRQRVQRAAHLARGGNWDRERHLEGRTIGTGQERLDDPPSGHGEERATRPEVPGAHPLRSGLDRPHIHLGHGEAQPQRAGVDRRTRRVGDEHVDHPLPERSVVELHHHTEIAGLYRLRDAWCGKLITTPVPPHRTYSEGDHHSSEGNDEQKPDARYRHTHVLNRSVETINHRGSSGDCCCHDRQTARTIR